MCRRTATVALLAAACVLALNVSATAATYLVTPDGSGDFGTIQDAIDAVSDTDIIELADGTFEGDGNRDIDFLGKQITVRSLNGNPEDCTIDCGGEFTPHRGFWFHSGEGSTSVLENISVVNGYVVDGDGGAILCESACPTITGCIFDSNTVAGDFVGGGAIFMQSPPYFVMTGCRFVGNTAGEFTGGSGGAISVYGAEQGEFHDCIFGPGNLAGSYGGGIVMDLAADSDLYFESCVIAENDAPTGAGLYCDEGIVAMDGCSVYWNEAAAMPGRGGGLFVSGSANIVRSTFVANAAATGGGMYFSQSSSADVNLCIVAGSLTGGGIHLEVPIREVNVQCCDVFDNEGGNYTGDLADQTGVNDNISEDPQFCNAAEGDLRLFDTSPCSEALSPCGQQIGALGVACDSPVEPTSWGRVKATYE